MILNFMSPFSLIIVFFKISTQGGWIGLTEERSDLYHLESSKNSRSNLFLIFFSSTNKDVIWLYHLRLDHPSFRVLKVMFSHLFHGLDMSEFHCDTCELAKHAHVSFPINNKRTAHHFHLIHSDIWGPSTNTKCFWSLLVCILNWWLHSGYLVLSF